MDKEKLKKGLEKVNSKIRLKNIEIENSNKYNLLKTTQDNLRGEKYKKEDELKRIMKPIYLKYVNFVSWWRGFSFRTKDIKSSVKQGIKKGLETTNILFINKYDFSKVVNKLIERDLKNDKQKIDKLRVEIEKIEKQVGEIYLEKRKLIEKGLNTLVKQKEKIYNKLNEKEILKNKRINRKQKKLKEQIDNHLPKYMDKIFKEVNKRLMLEGLQ